MFQSPGFAEAQRGQMWTHGNRHKPPGFRFGVNIKSHQGLVSRSFFFFFFQTNPQETTLVPVVFEGLAITVDFDSRP